MRHRGLDAASREFWQFSFHEIGFLDLPAMISYILRITQKQFIFYVGHNQGTTALMVLLSTRPEFNQKIVQAHLMAPIAFMDFPHPLIAFNAEERIKMSLYVGTFNFVSLVDYANLIIDTYCSDKSYQSMRYCANLWSLIFGRNLNVTEIDPAILLQVPHHISPTASMMQWNHYLQLGVRGKFMQYDFDGKTLPVEYNLFNVNSALFLYHAAEDLVVSRLVGS